MRQTSWSTGYARGQRLLATVLLAGLAVVWGAPDAVRAGADEQAAKDRRAIAESLEGRLDERIDGRIGKKRGDVIEDAATAVRQTRKALEALENEKPDAALAALEQVVGKLELVLARHTGLALAPISVGVSTFDLLTTKQAIEQAKREATEALEEGKIQRARELIAGLGSEIVINVTNVPLASFPEAIKAVAPLIDRGEIDQAKAALNRALNTLVITNHVIPLPLLRAEVMLKKAEKLAENEKRDDEQEQKLADLLRAAREQLEMGQALGYGDEAVYEEYYAELDSIEERTGGGGSGSGIFDTIKAALDKLRRAAFAQTRQPGSGGGEHEPDAEPDE